MSGLNWNKVRQNRLMRERGTEQFSLPGLPKPKKRKWAKRNAIKKAKAAKRSRYLGQRLEFTRVMEACRTYDGPPPWED